MAPSKVSQHIFHTFVPVVLLVAYLVALLAFLAPTPILADRVYLMHVSAPVSAMAVKPGRRYVLSNSTEIAKSQPRHKRDEAALDKRQGTIMVPVAIELQIGPLGACGPLTSGVQLY